MNDSSDAAAFREGLRLVDTSAVEMLYREYRKPVARAVEAAGGSNADGNTFFRVALLHSAMLADKNLIDAQTPPDTWLKDLAVAHFRDWASEKNLELPEAPVVESVGLPDTSDRLALRQLVRARRQWLRLDDKCRKMVGEMAHDTQLNLDADPRYSPEATEPCLQQYSQALGESWTNGLPPFVVGALTDPQFNRIWLAAEQQEAQLALGQSPGPAPAPENKTTRNVLLILGALVLLYGAWSFFTAPKSAREIYEENYHPPASILADRAERAARDSVDVSLPAPCEQLLEQADAFYQQQQWEEAAGTLALMIGDDAEVCKSDALFYLGIVALQMEEPEITIECLAKITDLERFGEDLYWYQALAFVQIAAHNPLRRDIARRAVERARSNTEIPARSAQAEKMLRQLED